MDFARSFLAMVVPEFLEPSNLMIIGVVGFAESQRLRLLVGSALIFGGTLVCALTCALAIILGKAISTVALGLIGSSMITLLGMIILGEAVLTWKNITEGDRRAQDITRPEDQSFFCRTQNLMLAAFIFGFLLELVQTSAILVFGLAASSSSPVEVLIGTATAHILSKTLLLLTAFGAGYLILASMKKLTTRLHHLKPELAGALWLFFIRHQIVKKARNEFSPSQSTIETRLLCKCVLAIAFIVYGISAWV